MTDKPAFLNAVLAFDAATCGVMGGGLMLGASALATPFGFPAPFLSAIGAALIGFALVLGWSASRRPAPLVGLIVIGNLAWSAASLVLVAESIFPLTVLGSTFVVAQALAVLAIAALEYAGLRRAQKAAR